MTAKATLEESIRQRADVFLIEKKACLDIHLADGLVDFRRGGNSGNTWSFFDAIMGMMVMLGCGCGILFPVSCDSVIPMRKLDGDVGATQKLLWKREKRSPTVRQGYKTIL